MCELSMVLRWLRATLSLMLHEVVGRMTRPTYLNPFRVVGHIIPVFGPGPDVCLRGIQVTNVIQEVKRSILFDRSDSHPPGPA
jgi:hypothetical protein